MTNEDKDKFYLSLGELIKNARKKATLTQSELADKVNMSRVSIVNIEKGRQYPPIHLLWDFAVIFNVPINELIPLFRNSEKEVGVFFERIIKNTSDRGQISKDSLENLHSFISNSQ